MDKPLIIITGSGMAGSAMAFALGKRGYEVTILEKEDSIAQKASGNMLGIVIPRFFRDHDLRGKFHMCAYHYFHTLVKNNSALVEREIVVPVTGYISSDFEKHEIEALGFLPYLDENHQIHKSELGDTHYHLKDCYIVKPNELCKWLIHESGANVITGTDPDCSKNPLLNHARILITATGAETTLYPALFQITPVTGAILQSMRPAWNGRQLYSGKHYFCQTGKYAICGATYETNPHTNEQRLEHILKGIHEILPPASCENFANHAILRIARRAATKDFMPIAGKIEQAYSEFGANIQDEYILTGLGSFGYGTAHICAESIASEIHHAPDILPMALKQAISPMRFLRRDLAKKSCKQT